MSVMSTELDRDGRVLPFRRRAFAAKRRKRSLWLMILSGLAGALLIVGLPLGLVAWVLTTPRFALRKIETVGGPGSQRPGCRARSRRWWGPIS